MQVFSLVLFYLFSLALRSSGMPSVTESSESGTTEISTKLNEGVVANEDSGTELIAMSETELQRRSFTPGLSEDFEIHAPSSHSKNYTQSETASNGTRKREDRLKPSDITPDLLEWEAPFWFQKNAPYYLCGYDEDRRPVWVMEWGKYPVRELTLLDDDEAAIFDKYLKQWAARIIYSIQEQNTTENGEKMFAIIDLDGLDLFKIAHPKSLLVLVKLFSAYQELILSYMEAGMVINVNFVAERVINLLRPILGRVLENIEFYGTNPAKWKPQLLRRLPREILPSWYGGAADFTPVKVYG